MGTIRRPLTGNEVALPPQRRPGCGTVREVDRDRRSDGRYPHRAIGAASSTLEAVDPATGAAIDPVDAPRKKIHAGKRRRRFGRWAAGVLALAATALGLHIALTARAVADATALWDLAVTERAALDVALTELADVAVLATTSGPADIAAVTLERQRAAAESSRRLRSIRLRLEDNGTADSGLRGLRRTIDDTLEAWITQTDAVVSTGAAYLSNDDDDIASINRQVGLARRKWRAQSKLPPTRAFPRVDELTARLRRPSDQPIPVRVTALTANGTRIDVDLDDGRIEVTTIERGDRPDEPQAFFTTAEAIGQEILVQGLGGPMALPSEPSGRVRRLGDGHLVSHGVGVWHVTTLGAGHRARRLDPPYQEVALGKDEFLAATTTDIIVAEYINIAGGHDSDMRLWRQSRSTGRRSPSTRASGSWTPTATPRCGLDRTRTTSWSARTQASRASGCPPGSAPTPRPSGPTTRSP